MTRVFPLRLRRFAKDEEGAVLIIPFVFWSTLMLGLMLSTIEIGFITARHYSLERALDESVREVRLNTADVPTHAEIKDAICDRATALPNCLASLRLEMLPLSFRDWSAPPVAADCVDRSSVTAPRSFAAGAENQVMMLRACFKFDPVSPMGYLSSALQTSADGESAIVSTSAFVQEPL